MTNGKRFLRLKRAENLVPGDVLLGRPNMREYARELTVKGDVLIVKSTRHLRITVAEQTDAVVVREGTWMIVRTRT